MNGDALAEAPQLTFVRQFGEEMLNNLSRLRRLGAFQESSQPILRRSLVMPIQQHLLFFLRMTVTMAVNLSSSPTHLTEVSS